MLHIIYYYGNSYCVVPPTVLVFGVDSVVGIVGRSVTLSFNITDDFPKVNNDGIRWLFNNGINITDITGLDTDDGYSFSTNLHSLTLTDIDALNEGNYTLMANNDAGTSEATIELNVEGKLVVVYFVMLFLTAGPVIISPPSSQEAINGTDVVFNCTSTAEPLHSITWLFNNTIEIVSYNVTSSSL